jgi:hypothetical protein
MPSGVNVDTGVSRAGATDSGRGEQADVARRAAASTINTIRAFGAIQDFISRLLSRWLSTTFDNTRITCYNSIDGNIIARLFTPVNSILAVGREGLARNEIGWGRR